MRGSDNSMSAGGEKIGKGQTAEGRKKKAKAAERLTPKPRNRKPVTGNWCLPL